MICHACARTNLLIVFHRSSPYCLCCETNESTNGEFLRSITLLTKQVRQSRCHANGSHVLSAHLDGKTGHFWPFDSKYLYKIQHCVELYIRKVLKNRKWLVASRYSLRSARFAKYRFLNLHILHFRCFIPCLGPGLGYVHFSTWLFISFRFISFHFVSQNTVSQCNWYDASKLQFNTSVKVTIN